MDMRKISIIITLTLTFTINVLAADGGLIIINQDNRLNELVHQNTGISQIPENNAISVSGYRVQLYSGNNPQSSKQEAFKLEKELTEFYPEMRSYVTYNAPFWKVRIGDFTSYYEALLFSRRLKVDFTRFENEIYVMKEDAVKPIYFENNELNEIQ
ncbi:MAG: SPOR domain-containing protein [Bacteroidia bacterium]|nr:SPOR domain-containing protein [Bacteroidia bacterium]